ncbi:MAG: HAD-IIB family hydrolase [Candidatus Saccharimonadales bacterium]
MTKKLIAFDLDDTLAITKSPISDVMSGLLTRLLERYEVCIISGGAFEQFKKQVVNQLEANHLLLRKLHLMPTCGTRYYRYNEIEEKWQLQYAEDLSEEQKQLAIQVLEEEARKLNLWCDAPAGEIVEDRGSQITLSALGQDAQPEAKYKWAKDNAHQRPILRDNVARRLPELEVRIGGTTSTDITLPGVDKAYGMKKLIDEMDISKDEILFVGDKLEEGGNDYPVKAIGIDYIAVEGWEDTTLIIETLVKAA